MINDELLECAEAVLNFLVKSEEEFNIVRHFNTPSNDNMETILKSHNTDMCDFAKILNNKLHLLNNPLWVDSPREFFSNHYKSEKFFEDAIKLLSRKNKINKLKQNGRIISFY